jgi:hypothetical protein
MGEPAMVELSEILIGLIRGAEPDSFRPRVQALCDAFPLP